MRESEDPKTETDVMISDLLPPEDGWLVRLGRSLGLLSSHRERRREAEIEFLNDRQADQHNNGKSLFFLVKMGRLSSMVELLDSIKDLGKRKKMVNERDYQGAHAIHIAYLYQQYEVAHYLVERFPEIAIRPYKGKLEVEDRCIKLPYAGETILHMCIVAKNYDEVRWLLEFYRLHICAIRDEGTCSALCVLLQTPVKGDFFGIKRDATYFGETPLHFAACTNDTEMFDLVLAYASEEFPLELFSLDSNGNNLLHICVLRELTKMYKHVLERARRELENIIHGLLSDHLAKRSGSKRFKFSLGADANKPSDRKGTLRILSDIIVPSKEDLDDEKKLSHWLESVAQIKVLELLHKTLNAEGHTPLTLAAKEGKISMFKFILYETATTRYSYGPITVKLFDLDSFELPVDLSLYQGAPKKKVYSAIEWLCITNSKVELDSARFSRNISAFSIPAVKKLIETKWRRVYKHSFYQSYILSLLLAALVTIILVINEYRPRLYNPSAQQQFVTAVYAVIGLLLLYLFVADAPVIFRYGIGYWGLGTSFGVESSIRGAPKLDKMCIAVTTMSFTSLCLSKGIAAMNLNGHSDDFVVSNNYEQAIYYSLIICVLSSWINLYYYLMAFDSTGPFVLTLYKIISEDVPYFMRFYFIILSALACAIALMTADGAHDIRTNFVHLIQVWWSLIKITVNVSDLSQNGPSDDFQIQYIPLGMTWFYDLIRTSFGIVVNILMLNLLIAIMSNTYGKYNSSSAEILLMEKYNIICSMERIKKEMDPFLRYLAASLGYSKKTIDTEVSPVRTTLLKYAVLERQNAWNTDAHEWWYFQVLILL